MAEPATFVFGVGAGIALGTILAVIVLVYHFGRTLSQLRSGQL